MSRNIKHNIMSQIKEGKISMRARWVFLAKKIGLQSGLALTIATLVFLVSSFFYYIKANNLLLSLHYGPAIWQKLLHSLPYDLMLFIVVLLILLNFIIKEFDFSYKKPFIFIFSILITFIIFWAVLLFTSNFNNQLRTRFCQKNIKIPFVTNFYLYRCGGCGGCACDR